MRFCLREAICWGACLSIRSEIFFTSLLKLGLRDWIVRGEFNNSQTNRVKEISRSSQNLEPSNNLRFLYV